MGKGVKGTAIQTESLKGARARPSPSCLLCPWALPERPTEQIHGDPEPPCVAALDFRMEAFRPHPFLVIPLAVTLSLRPQL